MCRLWSTFRLPSCSDTWRKATGPRAQSHCLPGLPSPILKVGTVYEERSEWQWDFGVVTTGDEASGAAFTRMEQDLRRAIVDMADMDPCIALFDTTGPRVKINRFCQQKLDDFSQQATAILHEVLGSSAPDLAVEVDPEEALRTGLPVRLVADDYGVLERINVRELSEAQKRWSLIAMRLAYSSTFRVSGAANILILDEPDASLHVSARRSLSLGLIGLVDRLGLTAFVTTHAMELIDLPGARLWHTSRVEGRVALSRLSTSELSQLSPETLGVRRSDILLLTRTWLVVEGDHDEAVLEAWIGDELKIHMVRMLKMRGTHRALSVLDSQLLFDGTDAHVVVLTDNTRGPVVTRSTSFLAESSTSHPGPLIAKMQRLLQTAEREEQILVDLAVATVKRGLSSRLTFLGLSKPDIIEYLPVDSFVPGSTWPALVNEWKRSAQPRSRRPDFKKWLREVKGAKVSASSLRSAAERADTIPEDVTRVLQHLAAVH